MRRIVYISICLLIASCGQNNKEQCDAKIEKLKQTCVNLDYIDLDYGILGGYYSLGTQGPTTGGGTGYALFKTEFTTGGMHFRAAVDENDNLIQTIQPGEYAVEPLRK